MFIVPIEAMKLMEFSESGANLKEQPKTSSFRNVLDNAVLALNDTYDTSRNDAYRLALGDVDNIGEVMINTLKAETMIQTTVQITTRVVNAYKEILNMQV